MNKKENFCVDKSWMNFFLSKYPFLIQWLLYLLVDTAQVYSFLVGVGVEKLVEHAFLQVDNIPYKTRVSMLCQCCVLIECVRFGDIAIRMSRNQPSYLLRIAQDSVLALSWVFLVLGTAHASCSVIQTYR